MPRDYVKTYILFWKLWAEKNRRRKNKRMERQNIALSKIGILYNYKIPTRI